MESITSVVEFITLVKSVLSSWKSNRLPWFRGQPVDKPLLPKLFRATYSENNIVQVFRMKAPTMGVTPNRENNDEWLFLMQHHGSPTRLLDWTEGALIALFFATCPFLGATDQPVVWMLNPLELNRVSINKPHFPLSWANEGWEYVNAAFKRKESNYSLPLAFYPTNIHQRINVQRSCFTIHGASKKPIENLLEKTELPRKKYLIKFPVDRDSLDTIQTDLKVLGISYSMLFPDFDGLSKELESFLRHPSISGP